MALLMKKKDKIKKLHELGISVKNESEEQLNRMLIDAWVEDE